MLDMQEEAMKTQRQEVLELIQRRKRITRVDASRKFIFELASRIGELETIGDDSGRVWKFDKGWLKGKNENGRKWRVRTYSNPQQVGLRLSQIVDTFAA